MWTDIACMHTYIYATVSNTTTNAWSSSTAVRTFFSGIALQQYTNQKACVVPAVVAVLVVTVLQAWVLD